MSCIFFINIPAFLFAFFFPVFDCLFDCSLVVFIAKDKQYLQSGDRLSVGRV